MEESPFLQEEEPIHLVPFISDYGFKVTFGDENSAFTKKAIELLAQLDQPIEKLTMLRSEFAGINAEQRSGIYDVFCQRTAPFLYFLSLHFHDTEREGRISRHSAHTLHLYCRESNHGGRRLLSTD